MKKNDLFFITAVSLALWFAVTSMFWPYWAALFIAYPFGIISLLIWRKIKKDGRKRNRVIPILLLVGLALSLGMLVAIWCT